MKRTIFLPAAFLAVFAAVALTGCGSKPIDELRMTRTAMEKAREAEAPEYEPYDWGRAQAQWEEANALIQMGRYNEARNILIEAVGTFNSAQDKARRRVESLKIEITALQSSLETELKNLEQAAASGKTKPFMKTRVERSIPLIEEKISMMNADFDAKEYLRSRLAGHEALRFIQDLQKRLAAG